MISAYSSRNFRRICQSIVKNLIDLYMYFIFDPGGEGVSLLTVTIVLHIQNLKNEFRAYFHPYPSPPKIHDLLNKELSAAIKRRFENLSLSKSVLMQCTLYIRLYVKAQA